ncbi:hypothetical protein [Kitasatospora griseola]|uniref:hypothetical protein n=1 Tax=Kitasatospora griseola TaxID=2064 RepID=UPI003413A38C
MTSAPHTPDLPSQVGVGPKWADTFLSAVAEAAGKHRTRLQATSTMPHTAYTGQLDTSRPGHLVCSVSLPGRPKARTTITVGALTDARWDEVAAAATRHPGILGAVQTGRVHLDLLDPAHTAGHPVLPSAFAFECTAHPAAAAGPGGFFCQHAAVLAHALASRIRQQPAALLTLRGCSLGRLQAKVRSARLVSAGPRTTAPQPHSARTEAAAAAVPAGSGKPAAHALPGSVQAALLFSHWHPPVPAAGEEPAGDVASAEVVLPAPATGVSPGVAAVRGTAAARAQAALSSRTIELAGTPLTDVVRHLATPQGAALAEVVAERLGRPLVEVRRLVVAHRHGGQSGVLATEGAGEADPETVAQAVAVIAAAQPTLRGSLVAEDNRVEAGGAQVRLVEGRWFPFAAVRGGVWQPVAGASADPAAAFRAARTARLTAAR